MDASFSFSKSPVKTDFSLPSLNQLETQWQKVMQLHKDKKHKDSVLNLIDYCNPQMRRAYGNESQSEFNFPHGSVIVQLRLTETELMITVPFLYIPAESSTPLLRKVAEANFSDFTLSQIIKRNDQLFIEFKSKLELCEPNKLYDVIHNICINADFFDDEFTSLFGAKRLKEAQITPYDSELRDKAWNIFNNTLQETEQYIAYFESRRQPAYVWDTLALCFYRLDYYIKPQGNLINTIRKSVSALNNRNVHYIDRVATVKKTLNELKALTQEEFNKDLYFVQEFVPWKSYGRLEKIQSYLEDPFELATNEFNNNDYMACSLTILQNYTSLLYYYKLSEEIEAFIVANLEQASSKSWKDCAEMLLTSAQNLIEGNLLTAFAENNFDMSAATGVAGYDMNALMNQAMAQFGSLFGKK